MIGIAYCTASTTSSTSQLICPTLRATIALFTTISSAISMPLAKEVPKETTDRVLGNAYTLVIAIYLLWIVQRSGELTIVRFTLGTSLAILVPLVVYIPLSTYLAPHAVSVKSSTSSPPLPAQETHLQNTSERRRSPSPKREVKADTTPRSLSIRKSSSSPSSKRPQNPQRASDPIISSGELHNKRASTTETASSVPFERRQSDESSHSRKIFHCPSIKRMRSVSPAKTPVKQPSIETVESVGSHGSSTKARTARKIKRIFSIHKSNKDNRRQSI